MTALEYGTGPKSIKMLPWIDVLVVIVIKMPHDSWSQQMHYVILFFGGHVGRISCMSSSFRNIRPGLAMMGLKSPSKLQTLEGQSQLKLRLSAMNCLHGTCQATSCCGLLEREETKNTLSAAAWSICLLLALETTSLLTGRAWMEAIGSIILVF